MIPTQAVYENSPIAPQFMCGLQPKSMFQSDQKHVFEQGTDCENNIKSVSSNSNNNSNNTNNNNHHNSTSLIAEEATTLYKPHRHEQVSSDDLFNSEYKAPKSNLTQYDTPSVCEYGDNKACSIQPSNKDCSERKKLLFMNQQSTPQENEKSSSDEFDSESKSQQDLLQTKANKDISSALPHQYLPHAQQKELFKDLLESDQKNASTHSSHPDLDKSLSLDRKKQSTTANSHSQANPLQKQCSTTIPNNSAVEKYQSAQQSSLTAATSVASSSESIAQQQLTGEQVGSNGNNSNRNGQKKVGSSSSTSQNSAAHFYPYYYPENTRIHSSSQNGIAPGQSHPASYHSSRGYSSSNAHYGSNSGSTSNSNNANLPSNNPNNAYSNYPYYSSSNSVYPHPPPPSGSMHHPSIPQGSHHSHHHSHMSSHHYPQEDIEYAAYNDMYASYYYPPYAPIAADQIDSKKAENEQSENTNQVGLSDDANDEYKKYYYGHSSSAYGYYPLPPAINNSEVNAPQPTNSHPTSTSNSQQNGEVPSTGIVPTNGNSQNTEYAHHGDKYDHHPSYRGYYDPKGYYAPQPSYYYPPMNDIHMTNSHQGNKKLPKKQASGNTQGGQYHSQMMSQPYPGMKATNSTQNVSKYEQGQEIYGHQMDSSYHNPYSMHSHHMNSSSAIYCDSSYYASEQQNQKATSTQNNFKKPVLSAQSDKENVVSKTNKNSNKENVALTKEKNTNQQGKGAQKQPSTSASTSASQPLQSATQSKKSNQQVLQIQKNNEQVDTTDQYQLDNQESSQQNNSTSHEIRKRKRKNNDQLKTLKIEYQKGGFWGKEKILEVAQITGLSESQVYKWCWDQKKKRLEIFKKKLGGKLLNGGSDQQYEDMSGEDMEEDSFKNTGSPEKMLKLNDETGVVAIKTNISKLTNDFTINQLQEKVLANKNRALQNITDKVLSKQNSKQDTTGNVQLKNNLSKLPLTSVSSNLVSNQNQNQENISPENNSQQLDDVSKRLHFNSIY